MKSAQADAQDRFACESPPVNPERTMIIGGGRLLFNQRNKPTTKRRSRCASALCPDPLCRGYAELARTYIDKLFFFSPESRAIGGKKPQAVDKAPLLDPDLPEAISLAALCSGRLPTTSRMKKRLRVSPRAGPESTWTKLIGDCHRFASTSAS